MWYLFLLCDYYDCLMRLVFMHQKFQVENEIRHYLIDPDLAAFHRIVWFSKYSVTKIYVISRKSVILE